MFADELLVLPLPGDVPLEIHRHDPAAVEGGVHQLPVRHRRRGGMGVLGHFAGRGLTEQLLVPDDLPTGRIQAKQVAGCPVRRRRGHEDAVLPDDGRRPADPRNRVRHARFSRRLHVSGRFFSCETPWPVGPRKPGQFSARQGLAAAQAAIHAQQHTPSILVISYRLGRRNST